MDPTQDVLKRLETFGQEFSQSFGQAVGPRCIVLGKQVWTNTELENEQQWPHVRKWWKCSTCNALLSFQRFTLGVRLYYIVMEAMLKSVQWLIWFIYQPFHSVFLLLMYLFRGSREFKWTFLRTGFRKLLNIEDIINCVTFSNMFFHCSCPRNFCLHSNIVERKWPLSTGSNWKEV